MIGLKPQQLRWTAFAGAVLGLAIYSQYRQEQAKPEPPLPAPTFELGRAAFEARDFETAASVLQQVLEPGPAAERPRERSYLAAALLALGRSQEADQIFARIVESSPLFQLEPPLATEAPVAASLKRAKTARVRALYEQATQLERAGKPTAAKPLLVQTLNLDPTHREARKLLRSVEEKLKPPASPPQPKGKGWLSLNSNPWAEVTIDGKMVGSTPLRSHELTAGTHRVRLRVAGPPERSQTIQVPIEPSKTTSRSVTFPTSETEPP